PGPAIARCGVLLLPAGNMRTPAVVTVDPVGWAENPDNSRKDAQRHQAPVTRGFSISGDAVVNYVQKILPKECYGWNRPALLPEGIVDHYISAINANVLGLDNSDPFDIDVCIEILKYYHFSAHILI